MSSGGGSLALEISRQISATQAIGGDGLKLPSVALTGTSTSSNTRPKSRDNRTVMVSRGASRGNPLGNPGLPPGSGGRVPLSSERDGLHSASGRRGGERVGVWSGGSGSGRSGGEGAGEGGGALVTQRYGDVMSSPTRTGRSGGGGSGGGMNIVAEAAGIETSNDVIEYYVSHGLSAAIKLFYSIQAPMGDSNYTPYDLLVVSKENVANKDVEHFTVSSSGVVHIRPGIQSKP